VTTNVNVYRTPSTIPTPIPNKNTEYRKELQRKILIGERKAGFSD